MASGDTKTNQYLDIAANGTRADLPTDTCCETRTQSLIRGVAERVIGVEEEVERLENNPDVVDIVATYADLQNYDTSGLTDKDIIRVLEDETHDGNSTYYRWNAATGQFDFVGEISGGSSVNVVQTTGTSTTDVMSQKAVTDQLFNNADRSRIQIGFNANSTGESYFTTIAIGNRANSTKRGGVAVGSSSEVTGQYGVAIGENAESTQSGAIAIGHYAGSSSTGSSGAISIGSNTDANGTNSVLIGSSALTYAAYSVGLGALSNPTQKGQVDISTLRTTNTNGYNDSQYRLLTGLYDPQNAHDAATKGYVDGLVGDVSAALNAINNGTGA